MILVSFADRRHRSHLRRLKRQARETGLYRSVLTLTEVDLDDAFRERHKDILRRDVRGFGYWIWKPRVLEMALAAAEPGEVVNYLDAGFFIRLSGVRRLEEYAKMAGESACGILGFKSVPPNCWALSWDGRPLPVWRNREWTKRLLLERFELCSDQDFLDDVTFEAGAIFVRNSSPGRAFVRSWLDIMESDYALIDDSESPEGEAEYFRGHRHDQACFNVLAYSHKIPFVSSREFWYPEPETGRPDWDAHPELPLQARRIRPKKPWYRRASKRYRGFLRGLRPAASRLRRL
mgnify:CR=1 FL=1